MADCCRQARRGAAWYSALAAAAVVLAFWVGTSQAAPPPAPAELVATARRGDATAQFNLARFYDAPDADRQGRARAFDLYCQAARQGHAAAAFGIGRMFFSGEGVARNIVQAAAWFRLSAERGHLLAVRVARHFDGTPRAGPSGCGRLPPRAGTVAMPNTSAPSNVAVPSYIADLVLKLAPQYDLDPSLVLAVIAVESAFQHDAVSPRRALGLMQLVPETAARFGVERAFDPEENIRGGMSYLRWLENYFDGDLVLVLAAYNAGEGAVERYGGVPPFPETKAYIEKIRGIYDAAERQLSAARGDFRELP
jgi:soluble lytic murein transglycosylase-like protein